MRIYKSRVLNYGSKRKRTAGWEKEAIVEIAQQILAEPFAFYLPLEMRFDVEESEATYRLVGIVKMVDTPAPESIVITELHYESLSGGDRWAGHDVLGKEYIIECDMGELSISWDEDEGFITQSIGGRLSLGYFELRALLREWNVFLPEVEALAK